MVEKACRVEGPGRGQGARVGTVGDQATSALDGAHRGEPVRVRTLTQPVARRPLRATASATINQREALLSMVPWTRSAAT
ncbi:hypothetical protein [Pseudonocardia spinosispora]|uniref:hypothetical protein n=1 Tax=Pseudonocardia spinosispora TaxID=103441 RepID=UPI0012EC922B|nr:hypothetical protein [Pseudonocardia spinosispora]